MRINRNKLKEDYEQFRKSEAYQNRLNQTRFREEIAEPILRGIIDKEQLFTEQLTALVQTLGNGCLKENFENHLKKFKFSSELEKHLLEKFTRLNLTGYTGRGLNQIPRLDDNHLRAVLELLKTIGKAENAEEVKQAIARFNNVKVPYITEGIYSPWLHYLKPKICPIAANRREFKDFLRKFSQDYDYVKLIDFFKEIKDAVAEEDLGLIDAFVVHWRKDADSDDVCLLGSTDYVMKNIEEISAKLKEKGEWYLDWNYKMRDEQEKSLKKPFKLYLGDKGKINSCCVCEEYITNETDRNKIINEQKELFIDTQSSINPNEWNSKHKEPWETKILFKISDVKLLDDPIEVASIKDTQGKIITLLQHGFSTFYMSELDKKKRFHNNLILYGPPGTGKTFRTKELSILVIENG